MADALRELAFNDFNCQDFLSIDKDGAEITLSYWESLDDIAAWRQHPLHKKAQILGKTCWYSDYSVEIAEISRAYSA
ncbi:MAG: antibiotic biosynthesis monooxygenase [Cellvibrionales bacterium]|nr:antibiotic biosynthesis monooxygenase [Cellvibrionales bacterium]